MEPVLQEIVGSVNGRFNLSTILDQLDKLRRAKRIDMDLYDKIYKRIIQESRNIGDKWYQKYVPPPKEIKEATSLNFSFDFKYDENNPNSTNRQPQSIVKEKQTFSSPTTFASPPTYETRGSRLTEFQSDYQKELTNQILKQISEGKKRSYQSEHIRSDQKPTKPQQRSSSLVNLNGISQMVTLLQRKVMQLYRFSLNKIIYICNEPIKLQDAEIQAEPQQVANFSIKNQFQIEQNIKKFEEKQTLQVLFKYFDNMKQYWLRRRNIQRAGNQVLAMRKTNYIQNAFTKLRKYAKIHKHKRLNRVQAEYFFKLKIQKKYFDYFYDFHNKQITQKCKKRISEGYLQLSNKQLLKECFEKFKVHYRNSREKYQNNLLASGIYQQKLEKLYFGFWRNLVMNKQQREACQVILKKCLRKWKQYLRLKEFNRMQKQKSFDCYKKQCKRRILMVFASFLASLRMKQQMHQELHKKYLVNLIQRSFNGFLQNVEMKNNKRQKYQLVGRFLQEIYVNKPFKILQSYKKERQIKKELDSKARMIYKMNKQRKLMNFWFRWAKQKHYHRQGDLKITQLKQLSLFLYFKRMRIAFQQSLWLKNLARIMKSKYNKEFIKELKLNNIHFKQQNKYPLKLKSKVFRAFRINVINHLKKQQFHDQLLSLHEQNLMKHMFQYMRIRAVNYRQKQINKRAVQRQIFGKYIAGPFYCWLNFSQQHSYKKSVKDNFDKLMIIKQYQKVFNVLNEYRWKKKMQKHKDNKFIPVIIKNLKVKHIRYWNAKMKSQSKIDNFCHNFTKLQMKIFFKHMQLIKVRDYQKKKYMAQGRIFYMLKFAFNQLNKYKTKKIKQRTNYDLIQKRQMYHIKKSSFKHMKTLFTFEQNVAYLTAVTILQIKRNLLQKYFKGFKDLIQQKKRPRDQIMKMNKLKKCFAGWKTFTSKQQGAKLIIQCITDVQKNQKAKLYSKLQQNNQLNEARIYYKTNLSQRVIQSWYGVTQSSQKVTYLVKLLNQLKLKQLKKQFNTLSENFKLSHLVEKREAQLKLKTLSIWRRKHSKRQIMKNFSNLFKLKQTENISYGLTALQENNVDYQIQEVLRKRQLDKIFGKWKINWSKSSCLKKLFNLLDKQIKTKQHKFLNKINKLAKLKHLTTIKIKHLKQSFLKKWSNQFKKSQAIQILQESYDSIMQKQLTKCAKCLFNINKQQIYNAIIQHQQKSQLFTKWNKLTNLKQRLIIFNDILTGIFEQKTYYKHCRTQLFFQLQNQQIKQLKGEFALKAFDKLIFNRQAMIFGQLQQDQQYFSFLDEKNRRTQIFCFTLWAKLTNESVAYKFICRSLLEIYKRNMINNMKVIKSYGDKASLIYQQLDDSKRKSILNLWFNQTQKRIAVKSIFGCLGESYDSFQNKQYHVQQFMGILKQASNKHQNATQLFQIVDHKFKKDVVNAFQKIKLITKGQLISNQHKRKLKKQSLIKWRKLKSIFTFTSTIQGAYERTLNLNLRKLKSKLQIQKANQYYETKLNNSMFQFLKAAVQKTQEKLQQLSINQNQQQLNIHFQVWFIECLKRNNQRKCIQRICRGFFLYHYRTQGVEFIKQLKLEKKLQQKAESESHYSRVYSVFKAWRMIVDERKMLKKYLQECTVEEKRGKSLPKNLPY